jgi:hypothetical protein
MKRKLILFTSLVLVLTVVFLYMNHNYLQAGDRDGKKECTSSSSCSKNKSNEIKAGGEWSSYEFVTDQACCDEMKNTLKTDLMTVAGVKEVKFSSTCNVSKMTNVSVYYASEETNEEIIAASVKGKNADCNGKSGSGCEGKTNCAPKNKKTDGKDI